MLKEPHKSSLRDVVTHINSLLHLLRRERGHEAMMRALQGILRSEYIHPEIAMASHHLPWASVVRGIYDCPRMRREAEKIIRSHM